MAVSVRNDGERSGYAPSDKAGIEGRVASTNYRSIEPRHERADVATHLERHFSSQVPVDEGLEGPGERGAYSPQSGDRERERVGEGS